MTSYGNINNVFCVNAWYGKNYGKCVNLHTYNTSNVNFMFVYYIKTAKHN